METCGGGGERGSMSQSVRPSFGRATDEGRLPCRSKRARAGRGGDEEVSERPLQRSLPRSTPSTLVRAPGEERPPAQRRDEPPPLFRVAPAGRGAEREFGWGGGRPPTAGLLPESSVQTLGARGDEWPPVPRASPKPRPPVPPLARPRAHTRFGCLPLAPQSSKRSLSLSAPQACSRSLVSRRPPVRSTIFAGKSQLKSRLKAGLGHSEALKGLPSPLGA